MLKPSFFQWLGSFFWPVIIKSGRGNLGHDLEIVVYHGKVMLDTRRVNYSFGKLHEVMMKLIQRLHSKSYSFDKVLMLGYGGGSAAQIIHENFQHDSQIVGVESDATIYDWAQRYFYSKGVKILLEDAFDYARRAVENEWDYDLIIVDLFIDDRNPVWPKDFWENLKYMMNSSGVAIINTMCDEQAFKELGKQLQHDGFITQPWNEIKENRVWVIKK